jgi:uncharacterized protein (TIGR02117 family)
MRISNMVFLKYIKILFTMLLLLFTPIILYILTAYLLSFSPLNHKHSYSKKEEIIYIVYNNIHSDILFNLQDISDEWIREFPILKDKKRGYISFGWGDKETYLTTPTWDQIKISTSLKALFINTPSLMHVTYYPSLQYFIDIKPINITHEQSKIIKKSIFKSFDFTKKFYHGYRSNDIFYASTYKYNFIYTCNTWTGDILHNAHVIMSCWTPFSRNIINSLNN